MNRITIDATHADYLFIAERTLNLVFKDTKLAADTSGRYTYIYALFEWLYIIESG